MTMPGDDYLWDKGGEHDPEVQRLEALLAPFRLQRPQLTRWQAITPVQSGASKAGGLRWLVRLALPAALVCLLALAFVIQVRFEWRPNEPWQVSALRGAPKLAGKAMISGDKLAVGQTIETDSTSQVRVRVAGLGVLDVEPNSRLRLIATQKKRHRLQLEYGAISAHLWAPPFSLAVETPSAVLFDLGCAFKLHVEKGGSGIVQVTSGWVEFETTSRNVIIPEGAEAIAFPITGPGTPYFPDATGSFKAAVTEFDTHPDSEAVRADALRLILGHARPRDAVTLLTLLNEVSPLERRKIVERLASLIPPPAGYTSEEIVALQTDALNAYWRALHIGSPKSWITKWKDALDF